MKYHLVVFLVKVTIHMPVPRNMEVWKTTICFLLYRLAFLYSWSYLKVSSKQENQDDLNGCSLVKHHSQVSSPLKLLARCAINVSALHGYFMCTWKVDTLLRIRKVSLLLFYVLDILNYCSWLKFAKAACLTIAWLNFVLTCPIYLIVK